MQLSPGQCSSHNLAEKQLSTMDMLRLVIILLLCSVQVLSKPTIYKKNENDKLEPVLIAVSSTVIPLSVYKVGFGVGVHSAKGAEKSKESSKLITVHKKPTTDVKRVGDSANIKEISQEEYNNQ